MFNHRLSLRRLQKRVLCNDSEYLIHTSLAAETKGRVPDINFTLAIELQGWLPGRPPSQLQSLAPAEPVLAFVSE